MEGLKPIRLREEDLKAMRWIGRAGCMTSHQLDVAVYSRGLNLRQAQRKIRLKRLTEHNYLSRLRLPKEGWGGSGQFVHFLLDKGVWELERRNLAQGLEPLEPELTDYVLHQLQINEVGIALYKSSQARVLNWRSDRFLMRLREQGMPLPVVPDASFTLETARGRRQYFLEVEREGEVRHWRDKVDRFIEYRYGDYPSVFGTNDLTVLTVAQDKKHLRQLSKAAGSELFWFALLDDVRFRFEMVEVESKNEEAVNKTYIEYRLRPARIHEHVWVTPYDRQVLSLLG